MTTDSLRSKEMVVPGTGTSINELINRQFILAGPSPASTKLAKALQRAVEYIEFMDSQTTLTDIQKILEDK
jgi:hypothetical protein